MSEQAPSDIREVWDRVTEMVKQRLVMPAVWRAMERGQPLVIDEGQFVIGYGVDDALESHLLQEVRYRNVIEQCLEEAAGERLALRTITGTTLEDWQQTRAVEAESARLRAATPAPAAAGPLTGWDGLGEKLIRHYAGLPSRQLPGVQGEFLQHAVSELAGAYDSLMGNNEQPGDAELRSYGRVLDRLADRTGVPAAVIAYLVLERRRARAQ